MADTEFLQQVHTVVSKTDESIKWMETMIEDDNTPSAVRLELLNAQTSLKIMSLITRKLVEHQMVIEEELERLRETHDPS